MPRFAVLIKTLYRDAALKAAIRSYEQYLPPGEFRLYIADDGPISEMKTEIYPRLRSEGHVVLELPAETGANAARNILLDRLHEEEFVLRADDDFCLTEESDIAGLAAILAADPSLGAIADLERQIGEGRGVQSGEISHRQGFMERRKEGHLLVRYRDLDEFEYRTVGDMRYALCHLTRNMLLIRRSVFEQVHWDERLRFAFEHEDFLLALRSGGWKIAFSPDSVHEHREDLPSEWASTYQKVKGRRSGSDKEAARDVFAEKWGIERISGRCSLRLGTRRHLRRIRRMGLVAYVTDEVRRRLRPGAA